MRTRIARAALVTVLAGISIGLYGHTAGRRSLLRDLARLEPARALDPRLSVATAYRPCAVPRTVNGGVPLAECPPAAGAGGEARRRARYAARAAHAARVATDPESLHALGLSELLWGGGAGNSFDRAIQSLQSAARSSRRPAPILSDLAVAYTVRAGRTQQPRDLLQALEAAEHAASLDPANVSVRATRAAVLEAVTLDIAAAAEWRAVAAAERAPGWRDEARARAAALAGRAPPAPEPAPGASPALLQAFVGSDPQAGERAAWDALGNWGEAVLRGDAAKASGMLDRARALGGALRQRGGDAGVHDLVRAIQAHRGPAERLALARAHHAYARAGRAAADLNYVAATPLLRAAEADAAASPVLRAWVRVSLGVAGVYTGDTEGGVQVFRTLVSAVDTARHPSLAARVRWTLASTLQRPGGYQASLPLLAQAGRLYERVGYTENRAVMHFLEGTARAGLGDASGAYGPVYAALVTLRGTPSSAWRHTVLVDLARTAAGDGLPRAALRIADEDVTVADRLRKPAFQAEARLRRAELRLAGGDTAGVDVDLRWARAAIARMDDTEYAHGVLAASLRMLDARSRVAVAPARAARELDLVVEHTAGVHARLLPALFARAEARLAAGEQAAAHQDLHRAMQVLDGERTAVTSAQLRASLMDAGRRVVDVAVMLAVAEGRADHALQDVELARTSFSPVGARGGAVRLQSRPGEVVVDYAVIGDTLLAWTLDGGTVVLTRQVVPAAWLERTIAQVRGALELGRGDAAIPGLQALHRVLVRPLRGRLGPHGTALVIIADGALAGVPFAALRDGASGRFLVQEHALRFAASLRDARLPPPGQEPPGSAALLVNPGFDPGEFPGLEGLPGAAAEVHEVAREYAAPRVLAGRAATRAGLQAGLRGASVVHYAGHAVFDEAHPERSYLALTGGGGPPRLTAAEVERIDLRGVRLVVLSACETVRGESRRSGGFEGLAAAFLAAGAGGVAGSLWRVDDRHTRALMIEFHQAYRVSRNGAQALRDAQVRMLRSPDAELRSPSAWAGFRYAGR